MASAIVAVGDELVSGFVLDTNSHWLAQQLRRLGRPVKRITAIRDRHDEIVEELRRCLADPEIEDVFASGGLGPTPDDRTFEAVAAALHSELVVHEPALERALRRTHLLEELEPGFLAGRAAPVVRELRFRYAVEARFYGVMRELEHSHPDVSVGSYPNMDTRELLLRASGEDPARVGEAMERIRARAADLGLAPI